MSGKTNLKTWGLISLFLLAVLPGRVGAGGTYSGGTGEPNNPYRIATPNDMNDIGNHPNDWDDCFILVDDINLAAYTADQFNIIGSTSNRFEGVFDGNMHAVSNFAYTASDETRIGLFGVLGGGQIRNLRIISPDINAPTCDYVGALVGSVYVGRIEHCCVVGGKVSANSSVGGLAGYNYALIIDCNTTCTVIGASENVGGLAGLNRGHIARCSASGSVCGGGKTGGLVGWNDDAFGSITDCSAACTVCGTYALGGLVGRNSQWSVIAGCQATGDVDGYEGSSALHDGFGGLVGSNSGYVLNSYATGDVRGESEVGGLVGNHHWGFESYRTIENCYSTGSIWGIGMLGGLVGTNSGGYPGVVVSSFWDMETSGFTLSAGGTGLTTAQMQDVNSFLNAGWDFFDEQSNGNRDVWAQLHAGAYMALWYEVPNQPPAPFTAGRGTPSDPYLVSTADQISRISDNPRYMNSHFQLTANVDLANTDFNSIGSLHRPFCGAFRGGSHTISHVSLSTRDLPHVRHEVVCAGLFSRLACGARVQDIWVTDVNIINAYWGGALVGHNFNGTIRNCYSTGGVAGYNYLGGLVGSNVSGYILNSYTQADVNGIDYVGGLAGSSTGVFAGTSISNCGAAGNVRGEMCVGGLVGDDSYNAKIERSCASGNVTSDARLYVGGLVGFSRYASTVNCCASGDVSGIDRVGGLVGQNRDSQTCHCYSTGVVSASANCGGLIGSDDDSTYFKCFWSISANPSLDGIGNKDEPNVIGKTTAEMQTESTFTDAGWDFVGEVVNGPNDIWRMCVDGVSYPLFSWQFTAGDLLCPDGVDLVDYSHLANRWQELNCAAMNDCDRADLDFSGAIDWGDLKIFCDQWLDGV